jgi:hypothetical protein
MADEVNFTLVSKANAIPFPQVPCPDVVRDFLRLFETNCVVACCEWDAIDLSEHQMRRLVDAKTATPEALRQVIRGMLDWIKEIPNECEVSGKQWHIDRQESSELLRQALELAEKITWKDES